MFGFAFQERNLAPHGSGPPERSLEAYVGACVRVGTCGGDSALWENSEVFKGLCEQAKKMLCLQTYSSSFREQRYLESLAIRITEEKARNSLDET